MSLAIQAQNIYISNGPEFGDLMEYEKLPIILNVHMPEAQKKAPPSSGMSRRDWILLAVCIAGIAAGVLMVATALGTGNILLEKAGTVFVTSFIGLSLKSFEKIL